MPFTTSHPAIVLLLKNAFPRYLSLTGLIAGAMSPDLLYFLEMNTVNRGVSHSWEGLFTVCLPLGLFFSFAFHYLFKKELILHLPARLLRHFSGLAFLKWRVGSLRDWFVLILSVLIGGVSHFAWDSCTHLNGEVVQSFPVLQDNLHMFGYSFRTYRFLQFLSTVVGAIGVALYFGRQSNLPKRISLKNSYPTMHKINFWLIVPSLSGLFAFSVLHLYMFFTPERVISTRTIFGLASWAGFFYLTILLGLYKRIKKV